jgi:predicted O-methyltransferase YrrM
MMDVIPSEVHAYALFNTSQDDALLLEIQEHTELYHPEQHMLSGPLQGQFLNMVSRMIKPKRVLEIGTFVGYSAICLAKGLDKNGVLHTIEKREDDAKTAQKFFDRSEYKNNIYQHVGSAMDILKDLHEDWDLVFVDADKTSYKAYYELLIERAKPGTWFLFDNVFFHGEVLKNPVAGKNAKAIVEFNEMIKFDSRVEKVMLTIRDGLTLLYKK